MDYTEILKALPEPGGYSTLAVGNYLVESQKPERIEAFEQAGLPDPMVVRGWWNSKLDLPKTDNYQSFLIRGILRAEPMIPDAGDGINVTMSAALVRLETLLRADVLGIPIPSPATEEPAAEPAAEAVEEQAPTTAEN